MAKKKKPKPEEPKPEETAATLKARAEQISAITEGLCEGKDKDAFVKAREQICAQIEKPNDDEQVKLSILLYFYASLSRLPGFVTINYDHGIHLSQIVQDIQAYLGKSMTRPLNFLLLASPGSGKSQLVKSIADKLGREHVEFVSFNMATMQSKEELGFALDAARNVVADGKQPLVFLDEFDSNPANYSLLLPVLWDGELDIGGRTLKLVRCVFFLAGSRSSLPGELKHARNVDADIQPDDSKLVDLFSRINGTVVDIPAMAGNDDHDPRPDKLFIAMSLLRRQFKKMGIHFTQVTPRCSIWGYGRLSQDVDGIRDEIRF